MQVIYQNGSVNRHAGHFVRQHIVTSAQATSGTFTVSIDDAPASLDAAVAMISTSGVQKAGATVTVSGRNVTVANTGTATTLTSGDVVTIIAYGSAAI